MKITKRIISLLTAALMLAFLALPGFAKSVVALTGSGSYEKATADDGENKKFTKEDAVSVALTAAKAKYATEGVSGDIAAKALVTKMKYNRQSGAYSVTVRANRIYKFSCDISVKNFLGIGLGVPENSEFTEQGKIGAFFGQGFEKISWFFIRLFGKDEA